MGTRGLVVRRIGDAIACLSVRSGFDLLLAALELPAGSEVLFSAITLPDMPRIAEGHGLVPVPVDLQPPDHRIDSASLRRAIGPRSRVLVVAHLYGARPELDEVLAIAAEHGLVVVEDCAQAWFAPDWRGDPRSDAALFSFGTIKTATALGGALCRIRDDALRARMRELHETWPVQPTGSHLRKLGTAAVLKAFSIRGVFQSLVAYAAWRCRTLDELVGGLTRGFPADALLDRIRRRPSRSLLRMLHHRLRIDPGSRITRRVVNALRTADRLGLHFGDTPHTFWVFPLLVDSPRDLIPILREHGYDTTVRGRLAVLRPPTDRPHLTATRARDLLDRTLFLPCYPELSGPAIDTMCRVIREHTGGSPR